MREYQSSPFTPTGEEHYNALVAVLDEVSALRCEAERLRLEKKDLIQVGLVANDNESYWKARAEKAEAELAAYRRAAHVLDEIEAERICPLQGEDE